MDKYSLTNETRDAEDDSSALYHVLLYGSGAALEEQGEVVVVVVVERGGLLWEALKSVCELPHSRLAFKHNGHVLREKIT